MVCRLKILWNLVVIIKISPQRNLFLYCDSFLKNPKSNLCAQKRDCEGLFHSEVDLGDSVWSKVDLGGSVWLKVDLGGSFWWEVDLGGSV